MSQFYALSITQSIVCVGCLSIELLNVCDTLPEPGTNQTCLRSQWQRGGHSSNVSFILRQLGAQVELLCVLSRSNLLHKILKDLRSISIQMDHCPKTDVEPAFSTILLNKKTGGRSILHCNMHFPYITGKDFQAIDLDHCGWVHFEARNIAETVQMMRVILDYNNGRSQRVRISFKINSNYLESRDLHMMCDYVIVSGKLAQKLGWQTPAEACQELDKGLSMPRSINVHRPCFVCTWGSSGAGCLNAEGVYQDVPGHKPSRVVDTYGVGEYFTAAFIYAIHVREMNLRAAVDYANRLASQKISVSGYSNVSTLNTYTSK
ncbi:hypothetical protein KR222_004232, partial [Zaprionus bogoriensis]